MAREGGGGGPARGRGGGREGGRAACMHGRRVSPGACKSGAGEAWPVGSGLRAAWKQLRARLPARPPEPKVAAAAASEQAGLAWPRRPGRCRRCQPGEAPKATLPRAREGCWVASGLGIQGWGAAGLGGGASQGPALVQSDHFPAQPSLSASRFLRRPPQLGGRPCIPVGPPLPKPPPPLPAPLLPRKGEGIEAPGLLQSWGPPQEEGNFPP